MSQSVKEREGTEWRRLTRDVKKHDKGRKAVPPALWIQSESMSSSISKLSLRRKKQKMKSPR